MCYSSSLPVQVDEGRQSSVMRHAPIQAINKSKNVGVLYSQWLHCTVVVEILYSMYYFRVQQRTCRNVYNVSHVRIPECTILSLQYSTFGRVGGWCASLQLQLLHFRVCGLSHSTSRFPLGMQISLGRQFGARKNGSFTRTSSSSSDLVESTELRSVMRGIFSKLLDCL